jgi:hypothetical protein
MSMFGLSSRTRVMP